MSGDFLTPEQKAAFAAIKTMKKASAKREPKPLPEAFFKRGDEVELGQHLAASLGDPENTVYTSDAVYRFNGLTWDKVEDVELQQKAIAYAGQPVIVENSDGIAKEVPIKLGNRQVIGVTEIAKKVIWRDGFFTSAPYGAAFGSTFVRVDGKRLVTEPMTREHRVLTSSTSPFELPANLTRPEAFDSVLAFAWGDFPDYHDRLRFFWEWLGAAIVGITTQYKDSPLFYGPKDSGKSLVLTAVASCFPVSSHRSVSIHAMSNEYQRAHLSGGRLNFVNELPARELLDSEECKAVLDGSPITCRMPHGRPFTERFRCANLVAANRLPVSRDEALTGRFAAMEFVKVVAAEDQDRSLPGRVQSEAALIAATALAALPALLARGHFIRPQSSHDSAYEWRMASDKVLAWAVENVDEDEDKRTSGSELYESFTAWSQRNGHRALNSNAFGLRLKELGFKSVRSNGIKWQLAFKSDAVLRAENSWQNKPRWGEGY